MLLTTLTYTSRNTRFVINKLFFETRAVCEIVWKSSVERGRPLMTIWRMRIACWVPKATKAHTACVMIIAFTLQQWMYEGASILRYTFIACLVQEGSVI